MMKTRPPVPLTTPIRLTARTAISSAILVLILATACTYTSPSDLCARFDSAPLKEPIGDPPLLVIMDPTQRFAVFHGSACATSDEDGTENIIKVQESLELPAFANRATVILNGWKVKYLHKDHEVKGVGTLIGKIELDRNILNWQAAGILSDKNFDDAYEWCYHYTVVAWNDPAIDAVVDHDDATAFCRSDGGTADNFFFAPNDGTTTALASFSSFLQNLAFVSRGTVAVLPRGFGFEGETDHHLLQIAYDLDHSETFVEQQKPYRKAFHEVTIPSTTLTSHADSGFVSWNARAIFKDNDKRRDYRFGEMVSGLGGATSASSSRPTRSFRSRTRVGPRVASRRGSRTSSRRSSPSRTSPSSAPYRCSPAGNSNMGATTST